MKVKCVSSDRSFVHERSSLNAGMSMVAAALVPHVSGATSHVAFHVVTDRPIISALFPEVFVAFSAASASVQSKRAVVREALTRL